MRWQGKRLTMRGTLACLLLLLVAAGCDTAPRSLGGPAYVTKKAGPDRGALGVSFNPSPPQTQGAVVASVIAGGPADIAGILPGDVLTSIDGVALASHTALLEGAKNWKPQQTVRVTLRRGEEELAVDVELIGQAELAELIQHDPVANQRPEE